MVRNYTKEELEMFFSKAELKHRVKTHTYPVWHTKKNGDDYIEVHSTTYNNIKKQILSFIRRKGYKTFTEEKGIRSYIFVRVKDIKNK